jgi:hypothetical protein
MENSEETVYLCEAFGLRRELLPSTLLVREFEHSALAPLSVSWLVKFSQVNCLVHPPLS